MKMHRILTARNLYQGRFNNISFTSKSSILTTAEPDIKCSYCRKFLLGHQNLENLLLTRHQSTRTASLVKSQGKKLKYKKHKKYVELLEVGDKAMTETKVSISKLHAAHLSKLASSPVSLGQLHQLTTKPLEKSYTKEVDPELLQSVKNKILKKTPPEVKQISLEDDRCALIYTSHKLSNIQDRFNTKQYLDTVKKSYYNFRKATLYEQRLQDLNYAIKEGVNHEFHFNETENDALDQFDESNIRKSPHAVFRELFVDNHLDSYDHELMSQFTSLQRQGISHSAIGDIYDDPLLHNEIAEGRDDDMDPHEEIEAQVKSLKVKKAKQELRKKRKEKREKRRAAQEVNMKDDIKDVERRGKQEALNRLLLAHLQLLCSVDMIHDGRKVLQYYRQRSAKLSDYPNVNDVKVYNILLHGYAKKGQLENTKELLSLMCEDKVELDAQSFAAVFECVERSASVDKPSLLNFYRRQMDEKGITLNDLLDKTKFIYDQREVIHTAIRRISPDFEPVYTAPNIDYDCPLLDNIKLDKVENRQGLFNSPAEGVITAEELIERGREQLQIEIKGEIEVQNINIKDENSETVKKYRKILQDTETEWRSVITEAFVRNLSTLKSQSNASHSAITLYPYLKVLQVDQFVELVMSEISKLVDGSETYSPTLKLLQRDLGTQVYHKYQIDQYQRNGVLEKIESVYAQYCSWYVNRREVSDVPYNCRQAWQTIEHRHREGASLNLDEAPWPMDIRQSIGKFLYNIIINDVKIDVNMFKPKAKQKKIPGVYKVHRAWGRTFRLELKPHPGLARLWAAAARPALRMRAALLPLHALPAPWAAPARGAYLITHTPLIRMPYNILTQWKRIEESKPEKLYPVLDSLNQLGEVPWTINKRILDLQLELFRSGGDKGLDIPPPSSRLDLSQFGPETKDAGLAFKRRIAINRARAEMHSLWCDGLYKLSLANHYRDSVFWLPHNMDFRGRVYACPPHLSALGADPARALLHLARRRPLRTRGLAWLHLHAVNLTGSMKRHTTAERLAYAESITDKILDSADRPLEGEGWWRQSEEPWQTLAVCIEIANAIRSGNPEEYMCGFPVHQDGSCNGLQHYAALGGDSAGAAAVNLAPLSEPQDVYNTVAALVEKMRARDAAGGQVTAQVLEGFVRRKVIKQTVMTTVYGVTRFGARLQIAKQLKDIEEFPKEHVWSCSHYLTTKTFDSLREMFTSTKLIQDWFTDCAKVISGVCGAGVEWETPLGLPVVQPYCRRAAPAALLSAARDQAQRPCTMKQRNAFPPNFIHSLDSTHMMLTSLQCQAAGITFVSVHDCFWTHGDTVDVMNKICREQFVALHSQPILDDLSNFLEKKYSYDESEIVPGSTGAANRRRVNNILKNVPSKGDFDIRNVLDSVYFFS